MPYNFFAINISESYAKQTTYRLFESTLTLHRGEGGGGWRRPTPLDSSYFVARGLSPDHYGTC
jgi:hypothetical protein